MKKVMKFNHKMLTIHAHLAIATIFLVSMVFGEAKALAQRETNPNERETLLERPHDAHIETHWAYHGIEGPEHWAILSPHYLTCEAGYYQSPINIKMDHTTMTLENFSFDYQPTRIRMVNNGHTIQVNAEPDSRLLLNGRPYKLRQFHFHAPSEHHVDGQAFAMELHLVHQDPHGHVVVVAVLMKLGEENMALATFWDQLPSNVETLLTTDVKLNPQHLIPETRHYFAYEGSLTTPPCTEGVHWIVLRDPIHISADQLEQFLAVCGDNARPVQALHNRTLEAF